MELFLPFMLYVVLAKAVGDKIRFYVAAPLLVAVLTLFGYAEQRVFGVAAFNYRLLIVRLLIFTAVYYALEWLADADEWLLWSVTFCMGLLAIVWAR